MRPGRAPKHRSRCCRADHQSFTIPPAPVAQVLQTTIGKGFGMVLCRAALGDPPRLASLGELFFGLMAAQSLVLSVSFDPDATWRLASRRLAFLRQS